jgi:hypothetical protein
LKRSLNTTVILLGLGLGLGLGHESIEDLRRDDPFVPPGFKRRLGTDRPQAPIDAVTVERSTTSARRDH